MRIKKLLVVAIAILAVLMVGVGCKSTAKTSTEAPAKAETKTETPAPANGVVYKDGTYEGISTAGMEGEIKVEVKVADGKIAEIVVTSQNETQGIGSVAVEKLPGIIVEAQSTEVDNVSGASVSSGAIKEAVNVALEQAK